MQTYIKILILFFILSSSSYADKVNVFEFTEIELSNLEVRKVRGAHNKTEYSVGLNDNGNYLKADGRFREMQSVNLVSFS